MQESNLIHYALGKFLSILKTKSIDLNGWNVANIYLPFKYVLINDLKLKALICMINFCYVKWGALEFFSFATVARHMEFIWEIQTDSPFFFFFCRHVCVFGMLCTVPLITCCNVQVPEALKALCLGQERTWLPMTSSVTRMETLR